MASILSGVSPASFLRDTWGKRPLLIRQALPRFGGILSRDQLLSLATREDAISRLVIERPGHKKRWERHDGPFGGLDVEMLPKSHWTVLVHGVESLVRGGWDLLGRFSFIPSARVDDLMVSYAADGGSVGPHDDRYDVFLLQGPGRRRWQISTRQAYELDPNAAIKVIKNFTPDEEWLLEPGDMLYLPPGVAHLGVAEGPCFTYSIGFLAPSHRDLVQSFLGYLGMVIGDEIDPDLLFEDAGVRLQRNPLEISEAMMKRVSSILRAIRWNAADIEDFFGRFLTSPKPHVRFTPPARPLSPDAFARRLSQRGRLVLALPSRGLVRARRLFFNGEGHVAKPALRKTFQRLIRERVLRLPLELDDRALEIFYGWYLAGYLKPASPLR